MSDNATAQAAQEETGPDESPSPKEIVTRQARELGALAALLDRERHRRVAVQHAINRLLASLLEEISDEASLLNILRSAALVQGDWYLAAYSDVSDHGIDPVEHFARYGFREGRAPAPELQVSF